MAKSHLVVSKEHNAFRERLWVARTSEALTAEAETQSYVSKMWTSSEGSAGEAVL